ncbi:MAG: TrkH family potassium uptake protein, partial [Oscillospiraceae bacterium]|nr:TrkH family potassium uptake protein [Oscillospiraceae bacterium]
MNYRMLLFVTGRILAVEAALMLLPLAAAVIFGEKILPFIIPILLLVILALLFSSKTPKNTTLSSRDGFVSVGLSWIIMSVFGALPFIISGEIPRFIDAFFETVSGFTTTGASILSEVESMSKSLLLWRSFTHWIGG